VLLLLLLMHSTRIVASVSHISINIFLLLPRSESLSARGGMTVDGVSNGVSKKDPRICPVLGF
jgi:hypothetical protein